MTLSQNENYRILETTVDLGNVVTVPEQESFFNAEDLVESLVDQGSISPEQASEAYDSIDRLEEDPDHPAMARAEQVLDEAHIYDSASLTKQAETELLRPFFKQWGIDTIRYWNTYDAYGELGRLKNLPGVKEELELGTQPAWSYIVVDPERVRSVTEYNPGLPAPQLGGQEPTGIATLEPGQEARMARSLQQGFGSEIYYHGTAADISEFDLNHPDRKDQGWLGTGVYMTDSPSLGSSYSIMSPGTARNIMPLRVRLKNPYYATLQEKQRMMMRMHNKSNLEAREIADAWTADLQEKGHDGVILQYDPKDVGEANAVREVVVFDPKNIRSSFAQFDPAQSESPHLSKAEGGLVQGPLSVNPDMLEYGMRRTPSERLMNVPRNPVLGGQQHMLAYITPEEASTLREQGGGVTPTGGQYRGPGGIASFSIGPPGVSTAGPPGSGGGGGGSRGSLPEVSPTEGGKFGLGDPATDAQTAAVAAHNAALAQAVTDARANLSDLMTVPDRHPRTTDYSLAMKDALSSLRDAMGAAGEGHGTTSQANLVNQHFMSDIFGESKGWFDTKGNYHSNAEIASMTPSVFSKFSQNIAGPKGDPKSPFGQAVLGLATPVMSLIAPQLSLPITAMEVAYGLAHPNEQPLGLDFSAVLSPVADALSFAGNLSSSVDSSADSTATPSQRSLNTDRNPPIGDTGTVTGQDIGQALSGIGEGIAGFFSPIGESLGMTGAEPSPFSVNPGGMGPSLPQPSVPPPGVPPLVQEDLLGTEMPDDWRGHTIEELSKLTAPLPPTTSIFARGGFVDKPLYSRS